jgi:hypothetical protein
MAVGDLRIWHLPGRSGIYTGSAIDVGTGPVLILLACAFWPAGRARRPD